jgi:hypothetical protein
LPANLWRMSSRRQAAKLRRVLYLISAIALVVVGLGWWAGRAMKAYQPSPVDALLLEVMRPALRVTAALRNSVDPPPSPAAAPRPDGTTLDTLPPTVRDYLTELEQDNARLTETLQLRDRLPANATAAEVIGRANQPWQEYLLLDKGSAEGVEAKMVAVTPAGVIGQVIKVTAHTAQVVPLAYPAGGVGALVQRSGATGVLKGTKDGACELQYLLAGADVVVGDTVVTSGIGGIFPRGYTLGAITAVADDPARGTRIVTVEPAANLSQVITVVVFKQK